MEVDLMWLIQGKQEQWDDTKLNHFFKIIANGNLALQ